MKVEVENQPHCVATLKIELPPEQVSEEWDAIASSFARQARIPGYRPGKAPKRVIEAKFRKGYPKDNIVFTDVVEVLLLAADFVVLESVFVGGAFATGTIENVATVDDGMSFDFLARKWTVRVHRAKRILRASSGLDIFEALAALVRPRYLSVSSRKL